MNRPSGGDWPRTAKKLGRPFAADGAATRQSLIEIALRDFADNGYAKATLKEVAKQAGLTTGSVYHYFSSKDELYLVVAEHAASILLESLRQSVPQGATFVEQVTASFEVNSVMSQKNPHLARFILHMDTEARRHPELEAVARRTRSARDSFYRKIVDDAIRRGEISADIDPAGVVDALSVLRDAMARLAARTKTSKRHRAALDVMASLIAGTLIQKPAAVRAARRARAGIARAE